MTVARLLNSNLQNEICSALIGKVDYIYLRPRQTIIKILFGKCRLVVFFKKKWANHGNFLSFIFGLLKQTSLQFLQQIYAKKCRSTTHDLQNMSLCPQGRLVVMGRDWCSRGHEFKARDCIHDSLFSTFTCSKI